MTSCGGKLVKLAGTNTWTVVENTSTREDSDSEDNQENGFCTATTSAGQEQVSRDDDVTGSCDRKPLLCPVCGEAFAEAAYLSLHIAEHKGDPQDPVDPDLEVCTMSEIIEFVSFGSSCCQSL